VDAKAESSTRSQKLKQTKQCPFNSVQVKTLTNRLHDTGDYVGDMTAHAKIVTG